MMYLAPSAFRFCAFCANVHVPRLAVASTSCDAAERGSAPDDDGVLRQVTRLCGVRVAGLRGVGRVERERAYRVVGDLDGVRVARGEVALRDAVSMRRRSAYDAQWM